MAHTIFPDKPLIKLGDSALALVICPECHGKEWLMSLNNYQGHVYVICAVCRTLIARFSVKEGPK